MTDDTSAGSESQNADPSHQQRIPSTAPTPPGQVASPMPTTPLSQPADTGQQSQAANASEAPRKWWKRDRSKPTSFWRELPILIVVAFLLAVLIKSFIVAAFYIPSGSMEKTLHGCEGCSGDRVAVNKMVYHFRDPKPGDIVVFKAPPNWQEEVPTSEPGNQVARAFQWLGQQVGLSETSGDFVKRVIAVGGQTVACCDAQGRVMVDGKPLNEPYIFNSDPNGDPMTFGPVLVPKDRLWLMGDHRDDSADSHVHIDDDHQGTVSKDAVVGKAFAIAWPLNRIGTLGDPHIAQSMAPSSSAVTSALPTGLSAAAVLPVGIFRYRRHRRRR